MTTVASGNVLEIEHLTINLGAGDIIRDLSFAVPRGSSLAVIGPNGSGKTVFFRALIGALPYTGTVRWAPGTRVGYVPQKLDLQRDLPVSAGDLLGARARLTSASLTAINDTLARVGLSGDILAKPIGTLSGGQFQRLLVALALLGQPTVLLLDEPTASIDEPGQEKFHETVRRLQNEGVTVLLISHDLSVVFRFASAVLCLSPHHTCYGIPREVLTSEVLAEVYGQPVGLVGHD